MEMSAERKKYPFLKMPTFQWFSGKQVNVWKNYIRNLTSWELRSRVSEVSYISDTVFDCASTSSSDSFQTALSHPPSSPRSNSPSPKRKSIDHAPRPETTKTLEPHRLHIPSKDQAIVLKKLYSDTSNEMSKLTMGRFGNFQTLGTGGMGTVYSGMYYHYDPITDRTYLREVAMKPIEHPNDDDDGNDIEAKMLQMVSGHENIASYLGVLIDGSMKHIIMEKVDGPSVAKILERGYTLNERASLRVMRDVFRALTYIHEQGIAHLDINAENTLFTSEILENDHELPSVKLIDFGVSCPCESDIRNIRGTPGYIAPEILTIERVPSLAPADIWSSGVLFYEMLTGELPHDHGISWTTTETATVPQISQEKVNELDFVTNATKRLLLSCFELDPKDRPSAKAAYNEVTFRLWMLD